MRAALSLSITMLFVASSAAGTQFVLNDHDGKPLATVIDCSSCEGGKGASCESGVEEGFFEKGGCGKCLVDANFAQPIKTAHDVQILGYLKDEQGQPLEGRFIRIFLSTSWSIRTRTTKEGLFILRLGATLPRKSPDPVALKIGDLTQKKESKAPYYALYMMPPDYKTCEAKTKGAAEKPQ